MLKFKNWIADFLGVSPEVIFLGFQDFKVYPKDKMFIVISPTQIRTTNKPKQVYENDVLKTLYNTYISLNIDIMGRTLLEAQQTAIKLNTGIKIESQYFMQDVGVSDISDITNLTGTGVDNLYLPRYNMSILLETSETLEQTTNYFEDIDLNLLKGV